MTYCETTINHSPFGTERTTQCFPTTPTSHRRFPSPCWARNTHSYGTSVFRSPTFWSQPSYNSSYYLSLCDSRYYTRNAAPSLIGAIATGIGLVALAAFASFPVCYTTLNCNFFGCYEVHYC